MALKKTVVIDVVALTPSHLAFAPRLKRFAETGAYGTIRAPLPAVTCPVQTTYLTGRMPHDHGIVGNGWYFRDECDIRFWHQSGKLVQAPHIWDGMRLEDPSFSCANLFWWFNMYSSVDYSVTPRPIYTADGRKIPDVYTNPADWRDELQKKLGRFPLFQFWGPKTSIESSRWIADAARLTDQRFNPALSFVYLPHLDYAFQKSGPHSPDAHTAVRELDRVAGDLIDYYETQGVSVMVLSEYGIMPVSRPVHINRILRQHGLLAVREESGRELLDAGASRAFAVADHQVAHVHVRDLRDTSFVREILEKEAGIEFVLAGVEKARAGLDHARAGELVAVAQSDAWFTYYYWLDEARAPDFARTVDIHRKPGYDPCELFIDPQIFWPKGKVAYTLLKKKLGFRTIFNVIPLDATLVRGSHGRTNTEWNESPVIMTNQSNILVGDDVSAMHVCALIRKHVRGE